LHFVWSAHCSVHKASLKKYNPHNVDRRHKQQFAGWFEVKVSHQNFYFVDIMMHVMKTSY
jgi:hypothetical protein